MVKRIPSTERQSPAGDEEGEHSKTAQPLHARPRWSRGSESEEDSQDAAKQETEEVSQNVNALTSSPKYREQRKRCSDGKPGATPGCCSSTPDHAKASEQTDRAKYRSRGSH